MGNLTKKCSKCKEIKGLSEYSKDKSKKDGLNPSCKDCMAEYQRKYYEENREKELEYQRKYYEENREKVAERQRKHYEENREEIAEYKRKYYEENHEDIAEYMRKYREENREKILAYQRKYHEAVPDALILYRNPWLKELKEVPDLADDYENMISLMRCQVLGYRQLRQHK